MSSCPHLQAVGQVAFAQPYARVVGGRGEAVVLLADERVHHVGVAAERFGAAVRDDIPEERLGGRVQLRGHYRPTSVWQLLWSVRSGSQPTK